MSKPLSLRLLLILTSLLSASSDVRSQTGDLSKTFSQGKTLVRSVKKEAKRGKAPVSIVIYQTSDIHGSVDSFKGDTARKFPPSGGAASLGTFFKTELHPDMWLDSGDWFQGSPEGDLSKGDAVIDIFKALGLTATVVGNHDYDLGEENLARLAANAKGHFSILASNVGGLSGSEPYLIKTVKGVKIGIFGLLTTEMNNGLATPNNIANSSFSDEAEAARKMVKLLRGQGAQIVVALTHLGVEEYGSFRASNIPVGDIYLAKHVEGIDLILGGHTHVKMDKPLFVESGSHRTMIVQPGSHMAGVYRVVLEVSPESGAILSADGSYLPLDPDRYPPDAAIQRIVDGYKSQTQGQMDAPLGSSALSMTPNSGGEGLIYNWVTDAFHAWGKTDIGMVNTFGIRSGLPAGPLTYRDIYMVMPFPNQMSTFEFTGRELWKTIECSMPLKTGAAIMLRFSGNVRIAYSSQYTQAKEDMLKALCDANDPSASVAVNVQSVKVNGVDVEYPRTYTVATMDYVALSELKTKRKIVIENLAVSSLLARDAMAEEIRRSSPVTTALDGRVLTAP